MPTEVHEIRGGHRFVTGFHTDTDLVFPNVQTCLAVVGSGDGARLHGVHLTIAEKHPGDAFRTFFDDRYRKCTRIDVVGGLVVGGWSKAQLRAALGKPKASVYLYDTSEWLDRGNLRGGVTVRAVAAGGGVALSMAKANGSGARSVHPVSKL